MLGKLKTSVQFLAIVLAILRPGDADRRPLRRRVGDARGGRDHGLVGRRLPGGRCRRSPRGRGRTCRAGLRHGRERPDRRRARRAAARARRRGGRARALGRGRGARWRRAAPRRARRRARRGGAGRGHGAAARSPTTWPASTRCARRPRGAVPRQRARRRGRGARRGARRGRPASCSRPRPPRSASRRARSAPRTPHRGSYLSVYERSKHEGERRRSRPPGAPGVELVADQPVLGPGPGRAGGTGRILIAYLNGRLRAFVDTHISSWTSTTASRRTCSRRARAAGERYVISRRDAHLARGAGARHRLSGVRHEVRLLPPVVARAPGGARRGRFPRARQGRRCAARWSARCCTATATTASRHAGAGPGYTPVRDTFRRTIEWAPARGSCAAALRRRPGRRRVRPLESEGDPAMDERADRGRRTPPPRRSEYEHPARPEQADEGFETGFDHNPDRPRRSWSRTSPRHRRRGPAGRRAPRALQRGPGGAARLAGEARRAALQRGHRAARRASRRSGSAPADVAAGASACSASRSASAAAAASTASAARAVRRTASRPRAGCPGRAAARRGADRTSRRCPPRAPHTPDRSGRGRRVRVEPVQVPLDQPVAHPRGAWRDPEQAAYAARARRALLDRLRTGIGEHIPPSRYLRPSITMGAPPAHGIREDASSATTAPPASACRTVTTGPASRRRGDALQLDPAVADLLVPSASTLAEA